MALSRDAKQAAIEGLPLTAILTRPDADTPFTAQRGDANQFIVGLGMAYTF